MPAPTWSALTVTAKGGILRVIQTKCQISQAFLPTTTAVAPPHFEYDAIWGTGATASVITQHVVDQCGLQPTGMTQVHSVRGTDIVETYLVNILLPNRVGFVKFTVTKGVLQNAQVLIGMDVISTGDFSITNKDGHTVCSFRTPSQKHIDYVKEHEDLLQQGRFSHGGSHKDRNKRHKTFGKRK